MHTHFNENDAPLLIVLGQSNAHGHGTKLKNEEKVLTPYANVFSLSREKNQTLDLQKVTWSPFVTHGMNLGETQDHTCCLISEFSRMWQTSINNGNLLPDLYVLQISIGGQGIDPNEVNGQNMWAPNRPPCLTSGPLGVVHISLYSYTMHILALVLDSLRKMGKNPVILGTHWNQWETEVESGVPVLNHAKAHYRQLLADLFELLSPSPFYFYQPVSRVYNNEPGRLYIKELFAWFEEHYPTVHVLDISKSSLWKPEQEDFGIFQEDLVHYSNEGQKWFAAWQFHRIFSVSDTAEKVFVLGDSICDDGRYLSYLNCYLHFHPAPTPITFISLGVSSENVTGLTEPCHPFCRPCIHNRIDAILKYADAKQFLLCYGMNDGIYHPFSKKWLDLYLEQMELLVDKLHAAGGFAAVMTPPPFDGASFAGSLHDESHTDFSYLTPYSGYDGVLKHYGACLLDYLKGKADGLIDLYTPMTEDLKSQYKRNPNYQSGDGIHPNQHGHLIMAKAILEQWLKVEDSDLERVLSTYDQSLFDFMYQRDSFLHQYYKETIGHDNPEKAPLLPQWKFQKKLQEYEAYLKAYDR